MTQHLTFAAADEDEPAFSPINDENDQHAQSSSALAVYWRRFRTNSLALTSIAILFLLVLMASCAPLITPGINANTNFLLFYGFGVHGPSLQDFPRLLFGLTSPDYTHFAEYSVLTQVTYGARIPLIVSIVSALLSSAIGIVLGAISGYFGGWIDIMLMRVTDIFLSIPLLPLAAAIAILYPERQGSVANIITIFVAIGWPSIARLTRANFLALRRQAFAEAARAQGIGAWRIIFVHLLPNTLPSLIAATTLSVATFLVAEATLEFLTIGVTTNITWGTALSTTLLSLLTGNWWAVLFPGLAIAVTAIAFSMLSEALRDILDVRSSLRS